MNETPKPTPLDWLPAALRHGTSVRRLQRGEALFREGDAVFGIFEVEQGTVRLVRSTIDDREVILHTAKAGELFAEAALFADSYHCDAVATSDARIRIYPKAALLAALRRDCDLAERFMALLARQVQALRASVTRRNIRSARARLLAYLALHLDADGRTVRLGGSLKDLAGEIGLTHEALYRALARLESDGAIERRPGAVLLLRGV